MKGLTLLFSELVFGKWRKVTTPLAIAAVISAILFFPRGQADTGLVPQENVYHAAQAEDDDDLQLEEEPESPAQPVPVLLMVDVKGAVKFPNVYTFEEGQRVIDAITAAGGYTADADSRMLNHAQLLADQTVIYVPEEGEEPPVYETPGLPEGNPADGTAAAVNLNTADSAQLMTLSGIGPAKAAAIIAYRDEFGAFQAVEDLMKVSGIGQKTFETLADSITVD
ncbi:ComE operon protein 1 [Sporosarcina sp. NCCP-2716]|uniref:helix-hairpin-helix domain-containing protein n=1 Tax=Sporosarcina sp. NCCP-2716 TaxID=2943679 RepID=UPI0020405C5F|nr:helix-hairpin-helix domain-containing protein [Sporosarcina sp. NCCP-2716]GKV68022.1 ComE operon protein 1 [Sporosarcina sp. NCCP-2716]